MLSDIAAHRELYEELLTDRAVIADDLSPATLASTISSQLDAGRADFLTVPTWPEIADDTAKVYRVAIGRRQEAEVS